MNLHEYLFYNKLNASAFAKKCELSISYMCGLLKGTAKPSAKTMKIISRVTSGKVTKIIPLPDPEEIQGDDEKVA